MPHVDVPEGSSDDTHMVQQGSVPEKGSLVLYLDLIPDEYA